ncbi:DoxX family protein [Dactylosporangium sp. NPDC000244]|uniref:DoxX family protein n=1 Tax=Dactylosporangium sp. NPDC000244 TaxID=3154365 RepID=UPI003323139C
MNIVQWILAFVALTGGVTKTFVPQAKLASMHGGGWTGAAPAWFVRTLGVLELCAVAGYFVLPAVTAGCWMVLMVGAAVTHGRRGEGGLVGLNLVYFGLAAFVVWAQVG